MSSLPELAVDPERIEQGLARAGVRTADSRLVLERAWPLGTNGLSAVYGDGEQHWSVASSHEPAKLVRMALREGRAVALPEIAGWAVRLYDDPALPLLAEHRDPERARERLAHLVPKETDVGTGRMLSYKPLRRCAVSFADGAVIAKWIRPRNVMAVASRYRALAKRGDLGPIVIDSPVGICEPWSALVWRATAGDPLLRRLEKPGFADLARAVGAGLARLQRLQVRWEGRHEARAELEALTRWVRLTGAAFPGAESGLSRTLDELSAAPRSDETRFAPAHRDFHEGQLIVAGDRLMLFDLDGAGEAPRELDVANFIAHLYLRALQSRSLDPHACEQAFLSGHASVADGDEVRADALRWYQAAAFLRLACVYAFRPRWAVLSKRLLKAAQHRLRSKSPGQGEDRWIK